MKKIVAYVRPTVISSLERALPELGYTNYNFSHVKDCTPSKKLLWKGKEYVVELPPKVKLELVVADEDVEEVLKTIVCLASTSREVESLVKDAHYALKLRSEDLTRDSSTSGRWAKITPSSTAHAKESIPHSGEIDVVEIKC